MEDDNAGDEFCEEDIDLILQRRTKVIQIESEGKGSTFSKASFNVSENRTDIDIDDPNFWDKWAKKADIDTEVGRKKVRDGKIVVENSTWEVFLLNSIIILPFFTCLFLYSLSLNRFSLFRSLFLYHSLSLYLLSLMWSSGSRRQLRLVGCIAQT